MKYIIIIGLVVLSLLLIKNNRNLKTKLNSETNLILALNDTIKYSKNKYGLEVASKKALQYDFKLLKEKNINLNNEQLELINHVDNLNKKNKVLTTTIIKQNIKLDSVINYNANIVNNSVSFIYNDKYLNYNIQVNNVKTLKLFKPNILIRDLELNNKVIVDYIIKKEFIEVNITNTNKYIKTTSLNTFIIPKTKPKTKNWKYYVGGGIGIIGILLLN